MKSLAQLTYLNVPTSDIPYATTFEHASVWRLDQTRIEDLEISLCMGRCTLYDMFVSRRGYFPSWEVCEACDNFHDPDEPFYNNICEYHFLEYQGASGPIICWGDVNEYYIKTWLQYEYERNMVNFSDSDYEEMIP